MLWNLLTRSGVPPLLALGAAGLTTAGMLQFAVTVGSFLAGVHLSGATRFRETLAVLFFAFQAVFAFVALGSVSIRLFDPRRIAEIDVFSALPLRRIDRFLIQLSDVALVPVSMIFAVVEPIMLTAAWRAGLSPLATGTLLLLALLVCLQPLPTVVGFYALALRLAPPAILRSRTLLFVAFSALIAPVTPLVIGVLAALRSHTDLPGWLPASWVASAVAAAELGSPAMVIPAVKVALLTVLVIAFAWIAYDRTFLENFEEILAKLTFSPGEDEDRVQGRSRRAVVRTAGGSDPIRSALWRKELLGYWRDPALQLTTVGLGATALLFAALPARSLGLMVTSGVAFIAVYTAACLGLATFSVEGRGLPVLAALPLRAGEVLTAKLLVNTAVLALAGGIGGAAVGASLGWPWILPVAVAGLIVSVPLGGLVTAMGALFPRRIQRVGRREISPLAMGFFTALTGLFYLSSVAAIMVPGWLGFHYGWMPIAVVVAWACFSAALVNRARRAVVRAGSEG